MRTIPLLLCLALMGTLPGCVTDTGPDTTASTTPAPSGHNARASADKEEWWKKGGVTRDKISAMCWMKYEKGRADLPIDKRADLVDQCIAETSRQYGMQ
jgi:hypothetical protein